MDKVNEILAKDTLWEEDIQFLLKNESLLPESARIRLGLPTTVVEEPVVVDAPVAEEPAPVVETPKKRGRSKKV